jgi:hypothetical protein
MRNTGVTIGPRLLDAGMGKIVQFIQYHRTNRTVKRIFSLGSFVPEDVVEVKNNK